MRKYSWLATGLSFGGVLFAGYLSGVRLTTNMCAFNEPCPFFLGYPACYTGFGLFVVLFGISGISLLKRVQGKWPVIANTIISATGVLFAGSLTIGELVGPAGFFHGMGLPTCAYGMIFFGALLIASLVTWKRFPSATGHPALGVHACL